MQEQIILRNKIAKGDFSRGGETSSNLKEILRKLGIKSDINRRVTIVTYEMEMNIIIHSLGERSPSIFLLSKLGWLQRI